MASLTHVCMWTDKGWKRITAQEAARIYPGGTVSARSGIFMCELCGQYVILTNGSIRERYFKHSKAEKEKDCPERSFAPNAPITYSENEHSLPIRLKILSDNKIELEIGLIPVPQDVIGKQRDGMLIIKPEGAAQFEYSFSRLEKDSITYLSVGSIPSKSYYLTYSGDRNVIRNYWPSRIDGIDDEGSLFDAKTGKKILYDADVKVGNHYYLITRSYLRLYSTISRKIVCSFYHKWERWTIFEVCAHKFNEEAACFFLDYHCRLTEEPIEIFPLWPSCVETPYRILHKSDSINMFFKGDASPKLFPTSYYREKRNKNASLLVINCAGRQQLLSAGRTKILEYTYLWKDSLSFHGELPKVSVLTLNDDEFEGGETDVLPKENTLVIKCPYDGEIVVSKDNELTKHYKLHAEQSFSLDTICMDQQIDIYQGMDIVWSCTFKRKKDKINSIEDKELVKRLRHCKGKEVVVPHSFGMVLRAFERYPESRQWVYASIRKGKISEKALLILRSVIKGEH